MRRICGVLLLSAVLAACRGEPGSGEAGNGSGGMGTDLSAGADSQAPAPGDAGSGLTGSGDASGSPDSGGEGLTGGRPGAAADSSGPAAALEVIHGYYGAIEAKDFARAYRYWSGQGSASGQTLEQFAAGFAETATVAVQTGLPGRIDPGAGQRYIEIPAAVRANTTRNESQCFRGSYVLRRSEVDGATPEQRSWRISTADLSRADPELCDAGVALGPSAADTVAALVGAFGSQLASVSLLAPPDVVSRDLRANYGGLVTPALLDVWLEQPSLAPGRRVSSPWPARIDVLAVEPRDEGGYDVSAEVVYLTSEELARGGSASREPVDVRVVREGGALRIAAWQPR